MLSHLIPQNRNVVEAANPNRSIGNIASVCHQTHNIFGIIYLSKHATDKL